MSWIVKQVDGEKSRTCESRSEAESIKSDMEGLEMDVEIVAPHEQQESKDTFDEKTDGGEMQMQTQPVDVPDRGSNIQDDPLNWMPGHFVDDIQGTPAINRKGYAVLAAHYNIGVTADPIVRASETEFEYAEFQATAVTQDGVEYSGFGSAHVDRMDGDDEYLLNELAETRACKRALALATGVGVVSSEEMRGSL